MWKYDNSSLQARWSKKWHSVQWFRWVIVILVLSYALIGINKNLVILLPLSVIWWISYDGILNLLRGRSFWYQSPHHNLSAMEKYATPINKLLLLLVSGVIVWIVML
jgi:hypothetical protein